MKKKNDFNKTTSDWYTRIITESEIAIKGQVQGTFCLLPKGYEIWEKIKEWTNKKFKKIGIKNVILPSFLKENDMKIEADHIGSFKREIFSIKMKSGKNVILRPTSEVVFLYVFKSIINSYRQLPIAYNQWCNVFRNEENTKIFLRNNEFYWQEGHSLHSSEEDAFDFINKLKTVYLELLSKKLLFSVVKGEKSKLEKFGGAEKTFTFETLLNDKQSLQLATIHYFSNNFTKNYCLSFTDIEKRKSFPYQVSWGFSTRILGALILAHCNEEKTIFPPFICKTKILIIIKSNETKVLNFFDKVSFILKKEKLNFVIDEKKKKTLFQKISLWRKTGIPFLFIVGKKEFEKKIVTFCLNESQSINFESVSIEKLAAKIKEKITEFEKNILNRHHDFLKTHTFKERTFSNYVLRIKKEKGMFIVSFCGEIKCESEIKKQTFTVSRCVIQHKKAKKCFFCGKKTNLIAYFARSY